jgi:hypothetical protein
LIFTMGLKRPIDFILEPSPAAKMAAFFMIVPIQMHAIELDTSLRHHLIILKKRKC